MKGQKKIQEPALPWPLEPPRCQCEEAVCWWMMGRSGHSETDFTGVEFHGGFPGDLDGKESAWNAGDPGKRRAVPSYRGLMRYLWTGSAFFPRPQAPWEPGFHVTISVFWVEKNSLEVMKCKLWWYFVSDLIQGPRRSPNNTFTCFCTMCKTKTF